MSKTIRHPPMRGGGTLRQNQTSVVAVSLHAHKNGSRNARDSCISKWVKSPQCCQEGRPTTEAFGGDPPQSRASTLTKTCDEYSLIKNRPTRNPAWYASAPVCKNSTRFPLTTRAELTIYRVGGGMTIQIPGLTSFLVLLIAFCRHRSFFKLPHARQSIRSMRKLPSR